MRVLRDLSYGASSPDVRLDAYLPDTASFPVLVYFHGGGLEAGDKTDAAALGAYLASCRIALVSANYRLYPQARYPQFIQDAAQSVAWARTHMAAYGADGHLFVGGSSAGAYLSMMLCFDPRYLAPYGLDPAALSGFIHDGGQPTCHFAVLRERGLDPRRVIVDERAPLYYVGAAERVAPMLFLLAEHDLENRREQTQLIVSTLHHFGYGTDRVRLRILPGHHAEYGESEALRCTLIAEFMQTLCARAL